jgi:hypothetical protein
VIRLVLGVGLLLLMTACGGKENTHFTYAKSAGCFRGLGKTQKVLTQGQTAAHIETKTKNFEVLFLPSGAQAQAYTKQFKAPNGRLATKGNVIIYGHRNSSSIGPDVSEDELNQVKDCLA